MSDKVKSFYIVQRFVNEVYNEEVGLLKIIDGIRNDSEGLKIFIAIESWMKEWLELFFDEEDIEDAIFVFLEDNNLSLFNLIQRMKEVPTEEDIDKKYNQMVGFDIPILNEDYVSKTFYTYLDDMIDDIYPNFTGETEKPINIDIETDFMGGENDDIIEIDELEASRRQI